MLVPLVREQAESSAPKVGLIRSRHFSQCPLHFGNPLVGYALAVALISLTGPLRFIVPLPAPPGTPFAFFYLVLIAVSYLTGAAPGFTALVLGALFAGFVQTPAPAPGNWVVMSIAGPGLVALCSYVRCQQISARENERTLARFRYTCDHASDTILLLDETGTITYANHSAVGHFDRETSQLVGKPLESLVPETQRECLRTCFNEAKAGQSRQFDLSLDRPGRSRQVLDLVLTGVRTEKDNMIYASARDVTDRRNVEQQLREVRHWESLGVMAGGIAHDFNNLLTSIMGNASLAKDSLPADSDSGPLLDAVMTAGERSADLVRLMLATAGYRSRKIEWLHPSLILDTVFTSRRLPPTVDVTTQGDAGVFPGDRRSMETLFWSIISNAAESYAGERGQVRVTLESGFLPPPSWERSEGRLRSPFTFQEGEARGECLGIIVEDYGAGMRREVLERAFDPFFSTKFTGRGLGLPAARGIVRAYGGTLRVATSPGAGTRVEVWLPRTDQPAAVSRPLSAAS